MELAEHAGGAGCARLGLKEAPLFLTCVHGVVITPEGQVGGRYWYVDAGAMGTKVSGRRGIVMAKRADCAASENWRGGVTGRGVIIRGRSWPRSRGCSWRSKT